MTFHSQLFLESHKIPWFQSPPTSEILEISRSPDFPVRQKPSFSKSWVLPRYIRIKSLQRQITSSSCSDSSWRSQVDPPRVQGVTVDPTLNDHHDLRNSNYKFNNWMLNHSWSKSNSSFADFFGIMFGMIMAYGIGFTTVFLSEIEHDHNEFTTFRPQVTLRSWEVMRKPWRKYGETIRGTWNRYV